MSGRTKIVIGAVVAVVLVGGVVAFTMKPWESKGTEVRMEAVGKRNLVATVTASGKITPKRKVDVSADITGRIIAIPVKEGDIVKKGDLLLRIDPSQYEATVARAQAAQSGASAQALQATSNRDQAKRLLDRSIELRRTNAQLISAEQMEQAQ